jgi:hypothetical protein
MRIDLIAAFVQRYEDLVSTMTQPDSIRNALESGEDGWFLEGSLVPVVGFIHLLRECPFEVVDGNSIWKLLDVLSEIGHSQGLKLVG